METFRPENVVVRRYRRLEGVSDPDDAAIVYAIETDGGVAGTLVDAYGVDADPAISEFMARVPIRATVTIEVSSIGNRRKSESSGSPES